ncbi:MAG: MFS transporter [Chlamydiae bacterium]|nr:MFS transporter [Chlamydiota bacterium]
MCYLEVKNKDNRLRKYSKFSIYLTFFLDNFGTFLIYPIFTPLLLDGSTNFFKSTSQVVHNTFVLGLLIAAFPLSQFFGAPFIGALSDSIGRKKVFTLTISGLTLGYILTASAILSNSIILLFLGRVSTGLFAGNQSICLASLVDMSSSEEERTKNFSKIAAVGGLASISSISIGGIFSDPSFNKYFGPAIPFIIIAGLFFINLILILLFFVDPIKKYNQLQINPLIGIRNIISTLKLKNLRYAYLIFFFYMMSWVTATQFFPTLLLTKFHINPKNLPIFFIFLGVIWGLSNFLFSKFLCGIHPSTTLKFTLSILACNLLLMFFISNTPSYVPATIFYICVAVAALCWSNSLSLVSLQAESNIQGKALGINQSFSALGGIFGPIIGGLVASIDPSAVYSFSSLLVFASLIILLIFQKGTPLKNNS